MKKRAASTIYSALVRWDERSDVVDLQGQTAEDRVGSLSSSRQCLQATQFLINRSPMQGRVLRPRSTIDRHRRNRPAAPPSAEAGGFGRRRFVNWQASSSTIRPDPQSTGASHVLPESPQESIGLRSREDPARFWQPPQYAASAQVKPPKSRFWRNGAEGTSASRILRPCRDAASVADRAHAAVRHRLPAEALKSWTEMRR